VARGKIVLAASVLAGEVALDDHLVKEFGLCLLCGSCASKCPNRIPTDAIVGALRHRITKEQGLTSVGKTVATLTGSKKLLKTLVRGADLFSPLLFKKIPDTSGLMLRFSPELLKNRSLPPLPDHTLFDRVPEYLEGQTDKPVVGIFAGCALTYLYPHVGEILVRLPHRLGFSVFFPKLQRCCGMPAFSSGNQSLTDTLVRDNIQAFAAKKTAVLLTGCASCHGMLTSHSATGSGNPFGVELVDIHQFLVNNGLIERLAALPRADTPIRVTYHDPCHLRTAGIIAAPRDLLKALPQVEYVEMEDAGLCCGFGGTFTANHPNLSRSIGDKKRQGLADSGAALVASGCPGCLLQLQDIINRAALPMQAVHTLELINQALDACPGDAV
jgi:glycolate oxidase iron-sulfur subunit